MFSDILFAALRSLIAFILLMLVTRVLGRKAVSSMTFFDFAISITIGTVAGNITISQSNTFHTAVTVLLTLGLLGLLTDVFHIKSRVFRKFVNSGPVLVIEDGQINETSMRKCRLTAENLTTLLREKNIFNIAEVHYAVMENDGKLSVLPKAEFKPLTPKDMQIKPPESGLTRDIIIDGVVLKENLNAANLNEAWLLGTLKANGAGSINDVFYAGLATDGTLYISKRNSK